MHFIVHGAGAIGCYVGGRLAAGGRQVTLVGRQGVISDVRRLGLQISDLDGFQAHLVPSALGLCSSLAQVRVTGDCVVLLCVKGRATESAALELAACCPPGTLVVSLQNGVDNAARIAAIAPRMKVIAGMVACNVVQPTPWHTHRATSGGITLARHPVTREMALLMDACGLPTELADDMRPVQWGKLLLNLNNPVNALSDLPLRAQLLDRDYRRVLADLQEEALAVMRQAGIRPAQIAAVPPHLLPRLLRLPTWLFRLVAQRMLRIDPLARSSMWDDVQQGRITEINDLCGAVVRLARQQGMEAPRNAAMCKLIMAHHKGVRISGPALRSAAMQ
ncbi:MAG: 2-dehydropantoate 2-reductase [Rhodoferax sp.]